MDSLATLKILELGDCVSAAICGKLFAGFGASVAQLPSVSGEERLDAAEQAWYHTGKRRLAFDWQAPQATAQFEHLLDGADVVIDALGPGQLTRLGFDDAKLAQRWPQLIVCSITPFGEEGPCRDYLADDITLYAMSGLMNQTGHGAREPLNAQPRIARLTAGLNAYTACCMALFRRAREGGGDRIDLSMQESALENIEIALANQLHAGTVARRNNDNHLLVPWRSYPCQDGDAVIIGGPVRNWLKAASMFDEPRLTSAPLDDMVGRVQARDEFEGLMKPWLLQRTRAELFRLGQEKGLAWAYLASLTEALALPQLAARQFFVSREHPELGKFRMPGAPYGGPACHWEDLAAPTESESPDVVAAEWAGRASQAAKMVPSAGRRAPLAGVRIVDFTHDWAGPHTTRMLADYGADVVKIEYPKRLDISRGARKPLINDHPSFWTLHRGKQSLTLDLKLPEHLAICEQLVREADVLIENSRPGVIDRKGLPWDRVRELNPRIIQMSMSGYGRGGPISHYAGYGGGLEALSGVQSLTGYDDASPRYRVREMDVLNSIVPAGAVVAALWHRERTGEGQFIDFSELEGCAWYIGEFFVQASREGRDPPVIGNRHARYAPQGCYAAAGEDRWLVLSVRNDGEWQKLAAQIGGAALDARFSTVAQRRAAHDELDVLIGGWIKTQDVQTLVPALQAMGIAAGPVMNPADLAKDAHLAARQWFLETPQGRFPGVPFRFRDGGWVWRGRGPKLGEHNAETFGRCAPGVALPDLSPEKIGTGYEKA
jgi:crotonobetainyl-CoA:carnitine CoA-transferase CaiB-like acyl-CoA transferase